MAYRASVADFQRRRAAIPSPNARPKLVSPKVARLMGLGDYTQVNPTTGALVTYAGTAPGSAAAMPYPDGTLIQNPAGTVFIVVNGQLHGFPSGASLQASSFNGYPINTGSILSLTNAQITALPLGANVPSGGGNYGTVTYPPAPLVSSPTTIATSTVATSGTSTGNYIETAPTYNATLEAGAIYNPTTGMYTNPDGTIYDPSLASSTTSTFDITEPSTWPTWVWLALAAGGTWLLFLRRR